MPEFFIMEKPLMAQIITELKSLDLNRYEDYSRLVGIVCLLERNMKSEPIQEEGGEESG